jgi:hypothetical protein
VFKRFLKSVQMLSESIQEWALLFQSQLGFLLLSCSFDEQTGENSSKSTFSETQASCVPWANIIHFLRKKLNQGTTN